MNIFIITICLLMFIVFIWAILFYKMSNKLNKMRNEVHKEALKLHGYSRYLASVGEHNTNLTDLQSSMLSASVQFNKVALDLLSISRGSNNAV